MTSTLIIVLVLTLSCCLPSCQGQQSFRLANIYSNGMVLQMAPKSTQIWGWGNVNATIKVEVNSDTIYTSVGSDEKWSVRIPPQLSGGPHILSVTHTVSGNVDMVNINVWFGDIWICSGQSNMKMPIVQALNPSEEIDKAITYSNLRLFQLENVVSDEEVDELKGVNIQWSAPSKQNVPGFSALCLMFGERMSDSLGGRPIGLIDSTWGGTRIEAWSSTRVTEYCGTPPSNAGSGDPKREHSLWNGMIKPLTNMAVRGAIWYQGEANVDDNSDLYACHIHKIARDWKKTFLDGNVIVPEENNIAFPFGIAQIGPYSEGGSSSYGYLRWHQTVDLGVQPNVYMTETFMASTYDTTDPESPIGDIHPRDKQTVADRLANAGKALLYGEEFHKNGPTVVAVSEKTPGILTLTYDMDITVTGTTGFSFRHSDFSWVETTIAGSSGRDVDVNIESNATHLAYAWSGVVCDYKMCPIYSDDAEVLPAQVWLWNLALKKPGF